MKRMITDRTQIDALYALMCKGDPKCPYKIGDKVKKGISLEENEATPEGTVGEILGSIWRDDNTEGLKDAYLVQWENQPKGTAGFVVGLKLKKADGQ